MLEPAGWFERGNYHNGRDMNVDEVWIPRFKAGAFVWSPSPSVDRIVIEEHRQAK